MPRIPPWLFRQARRESPDLATLLPACRDLVSARNELRWLREHCNEPRRLANLCRDRGRGFPLQYILESQPFGHLDIKCRPGVLIPRSETEAYACHLADLIVGTRFFHSCRPLKVLDLCSGTGCISLLLFSRLQSSFDDLDVLGVDMSPDAIELALENVDRNRKLGHMGYPTTTQSLRFARRDIFEDEAMRPLVGERWDVLVSNPPYIAPRIWNCGMGQVGYSVRKFEPQLALVPGPQVPVSEGWERADAFYARLLDLAVLVDSKLLVLELGDEAQARRILAHFSQHPLAQTSTVEVWRDWPDQTAGEGGDASSLGIVAGSDRAFNVPIRGSGQIRSLFVKKRTINAAVF
ncbi:Modification methylase HemK [Ophiocordyceps camponoti-floridani]|uniref:Modification methylase HemK n=1 Tax=Ophiocordyceps camponoti-floridani TaxID=2030778 RepID=A0A8H4QCI1_9HYPO|nr:Modification methylase HemK [Ophiocordyceps camponoti-floridani]